ncbi:MAG: glycosyltransferase family 2 protein [Lachnospiraceae bacterium]|nr:glycosyltransferase family 2 protein [Lachnospiraceae bacterium]
MSGNKWISYIKKMQPYNIRKGLRYLRHFGVKEFLVKLSERMEPEEVPYGPWYEKYRAKEPELERQRKKRWKEKRLISIVVPAYRTPEAYLRQMMDSVLAQTYPYWELCIANGSPEDEKMRTVLEEYAGRDTRIRWKALAENGGIAANSNAALEMAAGEYAALLDHDDLLAPNALYEIAAYLERHPQAGMVYTDEDKVTADLKEHFQPNLKPDFNPDLLRSNNYICHLLVVRRDVAQRAGGFRQEYDGAQDYDFIFRCAELSEQVGHVPEILYHWRTHAASTADNPMSKMYAYEAGKRAIQDHLKRQGVPAEVTLKKDLGFYRVAYPVREASLISIVIPNKDERETLEKCLRSIREKSTYSNYEIILVENNSTKQETFDYYKSIDGKDRVRVVYWDKEFNYSAINNFGIRQAKGDYIICLNNDIEVITPGWMEELLGTCQRSEAGVVGARLYYPDDTIQHAGIVVGIGGIAGSLFVGMKRSHSGYLHKAALMQDLSAVTAACMMVKRSAWEEAGGFEEKLAVAFNDVDFCLKIREAGYLVIYDPYVEMYHYESKTRGAEDTREKVHRFQEEIEYMRGRWTEILRKGDPCYNKNLSLSKWNYSLKG